ncbi:hypothetical protein [Novosphingobium aquimarinum]|uniref:hypothetical protein n=1 Tax=Novosphingobium aquimarinum TaxID=2682494 RepID=UPI0012EC606A|nr:hypothetical protein [Novosphingobium aquimarinum]
MRSLRNALFALAAFAAFFVPAVAGAHPCPPGSLPELSRDEYPAPEVTGDRVAPYSAQALALMQHARRGYYGSDWILSKIWNIDALELAVISDLIAEGYSFRGLSRAPEAYMAQLPEAYRRLEAKAVPLGLRYSRVSSWEKWPGRPGLRIIAAMLKG